VGNPVDPTLIDPVTVNVLIVADGRLRFVKNAARENGDFSLSLLTEALSERLGPIARFSITTAFRQPQRHIRSEEEDSIGEGADFKDFHFTDGLRTAFDEVWFFGDQEETLNPSGTPIIPTTQLLNDEPRIVSEFMDTGGGVFATGDHLSLGASMSRLLPRVGSMRQWNGIRPGTGRDRNDTTSGRLDPSEETDEVPQTIRPRFYGREGSRVYPHPLLSGYRGTINVLPDHTHEGDCREDQSEPELREYNGQQPLIVADSDSHSEAGTPFRAIGGYDGHRVDRGRIVVDSSFRHFIDSNLRGLSATPAAGPPNTIPRADRGACAYEDIKTYYRNIATWLAPSAAQAEMFKRALWETRWRSRLYALLAPDTGLIDPGQVDPERDSNLVLSVGSATRDVLERLTSPAFTLLWSIERFKDGTGGDPDLRLLYPWLRENQRQGSAPSNDSDSERVVAFILGGVLIKFAIRFPRKPMAAVPNPSAELDTIVSDGVEFGLIAFRKAQ